MDLDGDESVGGKYIVDVIEEHDVDGVEEGGRNGT